jgi:hypothetical protein
MGIPNWMVLDGVSQIRPHRRRGQAGKLCFASDIDGADEVGQEQDSSVHFRDFAQTRSTRLAG